MADVVTKRLGILLYSVTKRRSPTGGIKSVTNRFVTSGFATKCLGCIYRPEIIIRFVTTADLIFHCFWLYFAISTHFVSCKLIFFLFCGQVMMLEFRQDHALFSQCENSSALSLTERWPLHTDTEIDPKSLLNWISDLLISMILSFLYSVKFWLNMLR